MFLHEALNAALDNAALYARLMAAVAGDAQVTQVFTNLRDASQERHLPAFRRCLQRRVSGGVGGGRRQCRAVALHD